jgi:hypothetical protein
MYRLHIAPLWTLAIACTLYPGAASAQPATDETSTVTGVVSSAGRNTIVVNTEGDHYQLFVTGEALKPASIAVGSRVRVISRPGDEPGVRIAESIQVLEAGAAPAKPGTAGAAATEPVPTSVRSLERDIERQARRWKLGVRAGSALDPELFLFGVHTSLGPFFHRDVLFRPNAEFAFGEVTTLIALNFEAVYRLPVTQRGSRWSAYIGGGPSFTFITQDFEREGEEDKDIDFDDFDFNTGFNILTGVEFRRGVFFEVKTSIYSEPAPTLRLILGYNF